MFLSLRVSLTDYNLLSHKGEDMSSKKDRLLKLFFMPSPLVRLRFIGKAVLVVSDEGFDLLLDRKEPLHLRGVKGNGETSQTINANRAFLGDFQRQRFGRVLLFLFQFRFEVRDLLLKGGKVGLVFGCFGCFRCFRFEVG